METPKYDPSKGLGPLDRILLRGASANKSWNEISELTNGVISPALAATRVHDILDSRDDLTQAQKKLLLVDDIMAVKDVLYQKAVEFKNLEAAKPLISVLTLLDKQLSADKIDLSKQIDAITRGHARIMLEAIKIALERTFMELERRHPEIDWRDELNEIFINVMPTAVHEIEARVVEE